MALMITVWDNSQADLSDLIVDCSASASAVATRGIPDKLTKWQEVGWIY